MFYECATTEDPVDKSYDNVNDDDDDIFNYSKYETTTSNDDYYHLTCLDNNNETSYNQIMTKAHSTTNLNTVNTLCAIENNKFGSMNFECVSKTRTRKYRK